MTISPLIADVQTIAGVLGGPSDIGCLCSDKAHNGEAFVDQIRINPYSFNKPIRLNSFSMVTEAQRKALNYGWDIPTYGDGLYALNTMINAKAAGMTWGYNKPRGLATYNEPFRIDDFRGYNHGAEFPPFNFSLAQSQVQQGTDVRLFIQNADLINAIGQGLWAWGWGSGKSASSIGLGVFIGTSQTVAPETDLTWCLLIGSNTMFTYGDIGTEDDKYDIRIPAAFMTAFCNTPGTYYITPFLTSANTTGNTTTQEMHSSAGNFFPFYGAQMVLEVTEGSVYNPLDSATASILSASGSRDAQTGYVTINQIVVRVSNGSTEDLTIGGDISIALGEAGSNIEAHASASALASGNADLTFTMPTGYNVVYDETKGHISIDLTAIVTLANGTITYTYNNIDLGSVEELVFS